MSAVGPQVLDVLWHDTDAREEALRRTVDERLAANPAPAAEDAVVVTYFFALRSVTLAGTTISPRSLNTRTGSPSRMPRTPASSALMVTPWGSISLSQGMVWNWEWALPGKCEVMSWRGYFALKGSRGPSQLSTYLGMGGTSGLSMSASTWE